MTRKTRRRTVHWSERTRRIETVSPYTDSERAAVDPRSLDNITGPHPYEASYDIALGYPHDRLIVLP
jgi:hypothetical protein